MLSLWWYWALHWLTLGDKCLFLLQWADSENDATETLLFCQFWVYGRQEKYSCSSEAFKNIETFQRSFDWAPPFGAMSGKKKKMCRWFLFLSSQSEECFVITMKSDWILFPRTKKLKSIILWFFSPWSNLRRSVPILYFLYVLYRQWLHKNHCEAGNESSWYFFGRFYWRINFRMMGMKNKLERLSCSDFTLYCHCGIPGSVADYRGRCST